MIPGGFCCIAKRQIMPGPQPSSIGIICTQTMQ